MGSSYRRFFDIYNDHVDGIQRKMVDYIKALQPSAIVHSNTARPDLIISTNNGYPCMPPAADDTVQTKDQLEKLIRNYLNQHYSE